MQNHIRIMSVIAAAAVLAAGIPHESAFCRGKAVERQSVQPLIDRLRTEAASACHAEEPFVQLRFSGKEQQLYRDAQAVGDSFAGFVVQNGTIMVDAADAGITGCGLLTPEEASPYIGCETVETADGDTILTAPFQSGTLIVRSEELAEQYGAVSCVDGYDSLHVLQYASPAAAYSAYQLFSDDSTIDFVQPDTVLHLCEATDAPEMITSWGVEAIGAEEYLQELRMRPEASSQLQVAVIDTGIYAEHNMFRGRIAEGGISLFDENDGLPEDHNGHGTHCAGIICSVTDENVRVLPIKALSDAGYGSSMELYCAMIYAGEQGADVVSLSLGGFGESPLLRLACDYLHSLDIPVVVAAGNEKLDASYIHPANIQGNFVVSAVGQQDASYELADFSNFGERIDFCAPGVSINSAGITGPDAVKNLSGTSMATPYVAGCTAALLSYDPTLTTQELYDLLRDHALDLGDRGHDSLYGWGLVQLAGVQFHSKICRKPYASLPSGSYLGTQTVSLSCTEKDAAIYYTLDGSVPDAETGILYQGTPIPVRETSRLSAVAVNDAGQSDVLYCRYEIGSAVPKASAAGGMMSESELTVTLSAENADAIFYTLDGTAPDKENGILYQEALVLRETTLLKAVSVSGEAVSPVMTEEYLFPDSDADVFCEIADGVLVKYHGACEEWNAERYLRNTTLTAIGAHAFAGNSRLVSVVLPDTVTEIGEGAFENCENLSSVDAKNVVHFGENAFRGCASLRKVQCDWNRVESIGASAFRGTDLSSDDTLHLDVLTSLGAYAFSGVKGIVSYSIGSGVKTLPEGAFQDAQAERFTFAGLTEIGAAALAASECNIPRKIMLEHPEQLCSISSNALRNCELANDAFPQLTSADEAAFAGITANALHLPALKTVSARLFEDASVEKLRLDAAETLAFGSLAGSFRSVTFDGTLQQIDPLALNEKSCVNGFAGAADSPMAAYAAKYGIPYMIAPAVLSTEREEMRRQFSGRGVSVDLIGDASLLEWRVFADAACTEQLSVPFTAANDKGMLYPFTAEPGTYYYAAGCVRDGVWIKSGAYICVTVHPVPSAGALSPAQSYQVIRWDDDNQKSDDTERTAWFTFTPAHDGDYYFRCEEKNTVMIYDSAAQQMVENTQQVFSLKAGHSVQVAVERDEPRSYGVLTWSETDWNTSGRIYSATAEAKESVFQDEPLKPAFTVEGYMNGNYRPLTEGTDYIVVYENNDKPCDYTATVYGIGDYTGSETVKLKSYRNVTNPGTITLSALDKSVQYVRFTPEQSGAYAIAMQYPDQVPEIAAAAGNIEALCDTKAAFTITAADGQTVFDSKQITTDVLLPEALVTLEQGKVYEIALRAEIPGDYRLRILRGATSLIKCRCPSPEQTEIMDTGEIPALEICSADGEPLTEGKDYMIYALHTGLPGEGTLVICGIGDYYGSIQSKMKLRCPFFDEKKIPQEEYTPFVMQQAFSYYQVELPEKAVVCLKPADANTVPFCASFYQFDEDGSQFLEVGQLRTPEEAAEGCLLEEGSYYLAIRQTEPVERTFRWYMGTAYRKISSAFITPKLLTETGIRLTPQLTVRMNGKLLTEGRDYSVRTEQEVVRSGVYGCIVSGIGNYTGETKVSFLVRRPEGKLFDSAVIGENHAVIETAGISDVKMFVPSEPTLCIGIDRICNATVSLYDSEMHRIETCSGLDDGWFAAKVYAGERYYLVASMGAARATGELTYYLQTEYRELDQCQAVYQTVLPYRGGESVIPDIVLTDEDGYTLRKETDYTIAYASCEQRCGAAQVLLRGKGRYTGTLLLDYGIYPVLTGDEKETVLEIDDPIEDNTGYCGDLHLYRFTAKETGMYYIQDSSPLLTTFLLADDGSAYSLYTDGVLMNAGESLRILCVTDWTERDDESKEAFMISVSMEPEERCFSDGTLVWKVTGRRAELSEVLTDDRCLVIPDALFDEMLYLDAEFAGFTEELTKQFSRSRVIYCTAGGAVDHWCHEHGICSAAIQPEYTMQGDVTGDGTVNADDALLLSLLLADNDGVFWNEAVASMADTDGDGILTIADVLLIQKNMQMGTV